MLFKCIILFYFLRRRQTITGFDFGRTGGGTPIPSQFVVSRGRCCSCGGGGVVVRHGSGKVFRRRRRQRQRWHRWRRRSRSRIQMYLLWQTVRHELEPEDALARAHRWKTVRVSVVRSYVQTKSPPAQAPVLGTQERDITGHQRRGPGDGGCVQLLLLSDAVRYAPTAGPALFRAAQQPVAHQEPKRLTPARRPPLIRRSRQWYHHTRDFQVPRLYTVQGVREFSSSTNFRFLFNIFPLPLPSVCRRFLL